MLVLTRKVGQSLIIDDDIKITLVDVQSGEATINIEAPPEVKVTQDDSH